MITHLQNSPWMLATQKRLTWLWSLLIKLYFTDMNSCQLTHLNEWVVFILQNDLCQMTGFLLNNLDCLGEDLLSVVNLNSSVAGNLCLYWQTIPVTTLNTSSSTSTHQFHDTTHFSNPPGGLKVSLDLRSTYSLFSSAYDMFLTKFLMYKLNKIVNVHLHVFAYYYSIIRIFWVVIYQKDKLSVH